MIEKLSIDSKEYKKHLEITQSVKDWDREDEAFMGFKLGSINRTKDSIAEFQDIYSRYDKLTDEEKNRSYVFNGKFDSFKSKDEIKETIEHCKKQQEKNIEASKEEFYHLDRKFAILRHLVRKSLDDNELSKELLEKFQDNIYKKIEELVEKKELPSDLWIKMLECNQKIFLEKETNFKKKILPDLKKNFLASVDSDAWKKFLPFDKTYIKKRLRTLKCGLIDPAVAIVRGVGGTYFSDVDTIKINANLVDVSQMFNSFQAKLLMALTGKRPTKEEFFRKINNIFFHEMMHKLSGRTIIVQEKTPIGPGVDGKTDDSYDNYEVKQVGLRQTGAIKNRLGWLNEGVTEYLTREICDKKSYPSYKNEVELLNLLCVSGNKPIDIKDFIDAYFEGYDEKKAPEEQYKNRKKLFGLLSTAYSRDFIIRLDDIFQNIQRDNYKANNEAAIKAIEMVKNFKSA